MDWSKYESGAIKRAVKGTQTQHLSKTTHIEGIRSFTLALTLGRFISIPPIDRTLLFAKKSILGMENACYLATLSLKPLFWHVPMVYGCIVWPCRENTQAFGEVKAKTDGVWYPTSVPEFEKLRTLVDMPKRICFIYDDIPYVSLYEMIFWSFKKLFIKNPIAKHSYNRSYVHHNMQRA